MYHGIEQNGYEGSVDSGVQRISGRDGLESMSRLYSQVAHQIELTDAGLLFAFPHRYTSRQLQSMREDQTEAKHASNLVVRGSVT